MDATQIPAAHTGGHQPLTERELAWVEQTAGREPGSVLLRLVAEVRELRTAKLCALCSTVFPDAPSASNCRHLTRSPSGVCYACGHCRSSHEVPKAGWGN